MRSGKHGNDITDFQRKKRIIVQAILAALFFCYLVAQNKTYSGRITSIVSDDGRPIMHTFYEKGGGGQDDLLEVWKDEWEAAGFEAKVLKLEDAKRHPYYEKMEKVISPIFTEKYNQMCYYRWLAMSVAGGGWMCDYDTFPTNFPTDEVKKLPNEGKFTSFESHVPSLMSGTAAEWTRVAELLVEAIPRVPDNLKSDMHAFQLLKEDGTHKIDFRDAEVAMREGFPYLDAIGYFTARKVDCKTMAGGRAVHTSHRYSRQAYEKGMYPLHLVDNVNDAFIRRGDAVKIFMKDWREQCGGSNKP